MRGEPEVSVRHRAMSSSQSSKVEVLWSPNKDEDFATYSNELKLYSFKVYMYVLEGKKIIKLIIIINFVQNYWMWSHGSKKYA